MNLGKALNLSWPVTLCVKWKSKNHRTFPKITTSKATRNLRDLEFKALYFIDEYK